MPPLLEVSDLSIEYFAGDQSTRAVDHVSFSISNDEFLGLVGESACGKSTLLFGIARLLGDNADIVSGKVAYSGKNLVMLRERQLRHLRWRDFSVVMQSAMNALNPVMTVEAQFRDALQSHSRISRKAARARGAEVLQLVGIDPIHLKSYPHQLSGGMRQRAMIAMALLFTPDLILMDEPTSALDVVAQRSLMLQIKQLQKELHFAVIFVTHDMALVGRYADRIGVMYAGELVEVAPSEEVFGRPKHPYTRGLLGAYPSVHGPRIELRGIPGRPPDLRFAIQGCRYADRCPEVKSRCREHAPEFYRVGDRDLVRCFLYDGRPAGPVAKGDVEVSEPVAG